LSDQVLETNGVAILISSDGAAWYEIVQLSSLCQVSNCSTVPTLGAALTRR
jgi:hypothetical protein